MEVGEAVADPMVAVAKAGLANSVAFAVGYGSQGYAVAAWVVVATARVAKARGAEAVAAAAQLVVG